MKAEWICLIENCVSVICLTVLAVVFSRWWIALFSFLFEEKPIDKEDRESECGRRDRGVEMHCVFDNEELGKMLFEAARAKGYKPIKPEVSFFHVTDEHSNLTVGIDNVNKVELELAIQIEDMRRNS